MRRSDREIKSYEEILGVLKKCDVIRIGIITPDYPCSAPGWVPVIWPRRLAA